MVIVLSFLDFKKIDFYSLLWVSSGNICPRKAKIKSLRFKARFRSISTALALSSVSFRSASIHDALFISVGLVRQRSTFMANASGLTNFW